MKIGSSAANILVTNADQKASKFKLQASGKAFAILSSALYQHKVRAVVREIGCNAYDAHVSANNKDTPFDVHLPTNLKPVFRVRDYGIGLSIEEFADVFATYFGSSKTDSNELIGGFGLGSKTPFILSSTFTVYSYYNGVVYLWTAYTNDNGEPDILLLSENETDQPNGLEVIVPIGEDKTAQEQQSLFREFENEAQIVYQWFDVIPNVYQDNQKVEIEPKLDLDTEDKWTVLKDDTVTIYLESHRANKTGKFNVYTYPHSSITVKMGNVVYDCNLDDFKYLDKFGGNITRTQKTIDFIKKIGFGKDNGLVFEFNIGELDIAPSRETLSLDNATELAIINAIVAFGNLYNKYIIDNIKNASTIGEQYDIVYGYHLLLGYDTLKINNKPVPEVGSWFFGDGAALNDADQTRYIDCFDSSKLNLRYRRRGQRALRTLNGSINIPLYGRYADSIIVIDVPYKGELRNWVNVNCTQGEGVLIIGSYAQKGTRLEPLSKDQIKQFTQDQHKQVTLFSELKITPANTTTVSKSTATKENEILKCKNIDSYYHFFTAGNSVPYKVTKDSGMDHEARKVAPIILLSKKGNDLYTKLYGTVEQRDLNAGSKLEADKVYQVEEYAGIFSRSPALNNGNSMHTTIKQVMSMIKYLKSKNTVIKTLIDSEEYEIDLTQVSWGCVKSGEYDALTNAKEYPGIYSFDRLLKEVLIPNMKSNTPVIEINEGDDSEVSWVPEYTGGPDSLVNTLFKKLYLTKIQETVTEYYTASNATTNEDFNNIRNAVLFRKNYRNIVDPSESTQVTFVYKELLEKVTGVQTKSLTITNETFAQACLQSNTDMGRALWEYLNVNRHIHDGVVFREYTQVTQSWGATGWRPGLLELVTAIELICKPTIAEANVIAETFKQIIEGTATVAIK